MEFNLYSLDKSRYSCSFGNSKFNLYQNLNLFGYSSLIDNLYMLDTNASFNESLHINKRGTKCKLTNENYAMLWHKRLGHIFKQRTGTLLLDGILDSLDLIDFTVCVERSKRKQTNIRKLGSKRSSGVLELIHTNICGPFPTAS